MSAAPERRDAPRPEPSYLEEDPRLWRWFVTTDHKRIALLYLVSITLFFAVGGVAATLMRADLFTPVGDLVSDAAYNRLFTIHGVTMVWFFLVPAVPAVFGNFLLPLMIGAPDVAFPRLNLASWYIFVLAGIVTIAVIIGGGVDTGWTFYTPFSTAFSNSNVILAAAGVFIAGFSSILTGINFIVTTHTLRAPGMTWTRLPLFAWSMYATSLVMVLATPVLTTALLLIMIERGLGVGIFDPQLGGDPLLFQHLFWFYSHPAVYIMILPGFGVVSEIVATFTRRRIFGYKAMVAALLAIAIIGFFVWGHHMFVSGQSAAANVIFSFLSFLVAIPSAVKVFNWTATLYKGRVSFHTPMLFALGFVGLFTVGGLTGLMLATTPIDVHVHDTYFVVAHFHFIMVGGMVMAYMGALHHWWPKMTGRTYPELLGWLSAGGIFFGFVLTFLPQFVMGYLGMPRRYHAYPPELQVYHVASSLGATILAVGYILPLFYLLGSLFKERDATRNPWSASGLEWQAQSPPTKHNFDGPIVLHDVYSFPLPHEAYPESERGEP